MKIKTYWFYQWIEEGIRPRRSHGRAYFSYIRYEMLTVLWPFHHLVRLALWADYKWNAYRLSPSLVDLEIRNALGFH